MKRLGIICLLMLVVVLPLVAQQRTYMQRTPEQEADKHTEMMVRNLSLTAAQRDTIFAINLKYAILRREATCRDEMLEFLAQKNEELRQVLTPEQYEQHLTHQREHHPKRPYGMPQTIHSNTLTSPKKDTTAVQ